MATKSAVFALLTALAVVLAVPAPRTFTTTSTAIPFSAGITAAALSTPTLPVAKRDDPQYCTSEDMIYHCNENEAAIPSFAPITAVPLDLFDDGAIPFKAKMARDERSDIMEYVKENGFYTVKDAYGTNIRFEVVPTVVTVLQYLDDGLNDRCTSTVGMAKDVTYAILYDGTGTPTSYLPATVTETSHATSVFYCPVTPSWGSSCSVRS